MNQISNELYINFKNYIYKIENNKFLIYNPAIHYWISVDKIGKEVFECIENFSKIDETVSFLSKKYNVDENEILNDILPLLNRLVSKRFFVHTKEEGKDNNKWINREYSVEEIKKVYPFNDIYIGMTDYCNLNCVYCFNHKNRSERLCNSDISKLDKEDIKKVLKEFKETGGKGVVFTGGEPTLNPDLIECAKYADSIKLECKMITNGTNLVNIDLRQLCKYINNISISLDSVVIDELDQLWKVKTNELLNNIVEAFKLINEISMENKSNMKIVIAPVISKINKDSLRQIVEFVYKLLPNCSISWNLSPYIKIDQKGIDDLLEISFNEYIESFTKMWSTDNTSYSEADLRYFSETEGGRRALQSYPNRLICSPSFFVNPKGDILPCQGLECDENILGNIHNTSLREIFSSDAMNGIINKTKGNNVKKCKDCELKYVCTLRGGICRINSDIPDCKNRMKHIMYLHTLKNS